MTLREVPVFQRVNAREAANFDGITYILVFLRLELGDIKAIHMTPAPAKRCLQYKMKLSKCEVRGDG